MQFDVGLDYAVVAICFFVAAIVLSQPGPRRLHIWMFAAFLLLNGLDVFDTILTEAGLYAPCPWLIGWAMVVHPFWTQTVYFYTRTMTSPVPLRANDYIGLHLLAALVAVALDLPYLLLDGEIKEAIELEPTSSMATMFNGSVDLIIFPIDVEGEVNLPPTAVPPSIELQNALARALVTNVISNLFLLTLCVTYAWLSLRELRRHHQNIYAVFSNVGDKTLNWLRSFVLIFGAIAVYLLVDYFVTTFFDLPELPDPIDSLIHVAFISVISFFGLRQGAIYEARMVEEAALSSEPSDDDTPALADDLSEKPRLPGDQAERIAAKLDHAMRSRRLFQNPNLTRRQLSDVIRVSEHRITEVLNQHLDTSFYEYVNRWRIENAKELLRQDSERSVLDIAMDVGFNSKSTFYTAFKKLTRQTPMDFRRSTAEAG